MPARAEGFNTRSYRGIWLVATRESIGMAEAAGVLIEAVMWVLGRVLRSFVDPCKLC